MKSAFAILFSLLLIATQTAFKPGGDGCQPLNAVSKACPCSHCSKPCCVNKSSVPQSLPIAPTRTVSQTDWQLLASVSHLLFNQPMAEAPLFSSRDLSSPSLSGVPLYERNCSYLI